MVHDFWYDDGNGHQYYFDGKGNIDNAPGYKSINGYSLKINADIGFPNSIVSKIINSGANDGVQTESYNDVTLTWKVTNNGYSLTLYCIYTK